MMPARRALATASVRVVTLSRLLEVLDVRLRGLDGDTELLADLAVPERSPALALRVRERRMGCQAPVEGPD